MNHKSFIDVDEFILRLEWLKEWMALKIYRDIASASYWEIFEETGIVLHSPNPYAKFSTFDQYCKYKQSL